MMNKLTGEQLQYLKQLKEHGKYRRAPMENSRIHREILYQVLYEYCKFRCIYEFRMRHTKMDSLPLSTGERRNAIRYGKKVGFLVDIDCSTTPTYCFTDFVLNNKLEGMDDKNNKLLGMQP